MPRKNRKKRDEYENEPVSADKKSKKSSRNKKSKIDKVSGPDGKKRNFIASIFHEMRLTSWPNRKQAWHDFWMVVEYTLFFLAFIILFDFITQNGLARLSEFLRPILSKL
ncbi:MAG: preprotein translocase subunit SecE [Streptococcaceae bacterium]|jgi:preprotein translocase subunit SecE|nr:preprotein translocase subunit SecE [Streptococcaceae bacterium]